MNSIASIVRQGQSQQGRWALRDFSLFAAIGVCLFAGVLAFYGSFYSVHQDLAGSVLSGRLSVTLGERFHEYVSYFPPAERVWFSSAARLSDLTGLRLDLAVVAMTGAAVLFSTGLAYHVRRSTVGASRWFLLFPMAVLVVLPILFKNVFGLREHMVALGMWPYLVLRVSDPNDSRIGWRTRSVIGLWLGAMLLFKYIYSIAVFLVELADLIVQKRPSSLFRIENIFAGTVVAIYLFLWLGIDPEQRAVIGAMFSAIDANLVDPKASWSQVATNSLVALCIAVSFRVSQVPGRVITLGLALVAGSIIAAWMQERWYSHHLFGITIAYVAWWWTAGDRLKWWGHVLLPLLIGGPIIKEHRNIASYQQAVQELDLALASGAQTVDGKRVALLTMHPSPYNQYLASHGGYRWNPLMNNAYVSAELQSFDRKENAGVAPPPVSLEDPGRRMLHDEMLRLWEDFPPDVLILDQSTRWPLRHIDVEWMHVFSKDTRFNSVLTRYRLALAHDGKRLRFRYFVRVR